MKTEKPVKIQARINALVVPPPVIPPQTAADEKRNIAVHNARAKRSKAIDCMSAHSFHAARVNVSAAEHFAKVASVLTARKD
jgi:hypothetical protein